jgi:poly-gamma-glutamate synthesis protein (capsule biosynthesis protein)
VPLKLEYCYTRLARGEERAWVHARFRAACAAIGTEVREEEGRLVIDLGSR